MHEIKIIENKIELEKEIRTLYSIINTEVSKLKKADASLLKRRIKFEELELDAYKDKFLKVLKTLHHIGYILRLSEDDLKKARLISIAGLCEMIKTELTTSFWEIYETNIGRGADSTIYNWILDKGIREIGIKLYRSNIGREFVQSLVVESGVPFGRYNDVLEFFIIFWKYFQHYEDIEALINQVNKKSDIINILPLKERHKFQQICARSSEFTCSFSILVGKLVKVFAYLENTENRSISSTNLFKEIEKATNINPSILFRNSEHFNNILERIIGIQTPIKMLKMLRGISRFDNIKIPDGNTVQVGKYHFNEIQYGRHIIARSSFVCVPLVGYTLTELEELSNSEIIRTQKWFLLKSRSRISVRINGKERSDLVRPLFIDSAFKGYIFFWEKIPASELHIKTDDGSIDKTFYDKEDFKFSSTIRCLRRRDTYNLAVHFSNLRVISYKNRTETLGVYSEHSTEPLILASLDLKGFCSFPDFSYKINNPETVELDFRVSLEGNPLPLVVEGKKVEVKVKIPEVMLFFMNTYPVPLRENAMRISGNRYILYTEKKFNSKQIQLKNFEIIREWEAGNFIARIIKWKDRNKESSVRINEYCWQFEKSYTFGMSLIKNRTSSEPFILDENQGRMLKDFELSIYPPPPTDLAAEIFLSIKINDSREYRKWMNEWPEGLKLSNQIIFKEDDIEDLFFPFIDDSDSQPAFIDLSICSSDNIFKSIRFWIFPILNFISDNISSGDIVKGNVILSKNLSEGKSVTFQDNRGSNRALLRAYFEDGKWVISDKEFSAVLTLMDLYTELKLKFNPFFEGILVGNRKTGLSEIRRKILKSELDFLDLIINSKNKSIQSILVNMKPVEVTFISNGNLKIITLANLSDNFVRSINNLQICDRSHVVYNIEVYNEHFSIEDAKFFPDISSKKICGTAKISGPLGVKAKFSLFGKVSEASYSDKISECIYNCNGRSELAVLDLYFDPEVLLNYREGKIILNIIKNGQKKLHPVSWSINFIQNSELTSTDLIDLIKIYYNKGQYTKALEVIGKIKLLHNEQYDEELKKIENFLTWKSIIRGVNLYSQQAEALLNKEYKLLK